MSQSAAIQTLTPHDLPLYCNGPKTELWNGHPRVFLPIQSHSRAECPYCGTVYYLDGEAKGH
ncbi:zinc-finger domain-containing protein [Neisseria leonii]|uniref:Zinc-finger domain-containing protein n=1 Tax=Neisseria leonii TaxID=2995413 RepID=A0A9X4IAM0_9NEIS|nr:MULTISPECIES: zinc-finger domain-containing protein [unclassified Neisseria]MDD9324908.1 zinc-finger domain-containing protein [Neisseria sp. 3986]MDD9327535.1 zinc-finger domain-containing protein [Neisseria sp. 51.81]